MADLEKLANIFGADTIKQIYSDGFSGSVQEAGKMLTDLLKSLRLFTLPLQFGAAYQDRLVKTLDKVRNSVPEERQMEAPASLAGPIMERLKYLEDENYLTDLYLNLLSRAIDKERINEAHPAFFSIISQLSPDEALILFKLSEAEINVISHQDFDNTKKLFSNYQITKNELSLNELTFPEHFQMYYSHLESLALVKWPVLKTEYPRNEANVQIGLIKHFKLVLTDFGKLFVKACIPESGFIFMK
jgi:hypothetical protein